MERNHTLSSEHLTYDNFRMPSAPFLRAPMRFTLKFLNLKIHKKKPSKVLFTFLTLRLKIIKTVEMARCLMYINKFTSIIFVLLIYCVVAQAETDPVAALNSALSDSKSIITRQRLEKTYIRQCSWNGEPGPNKCIGASERNTLVNYKETATVKDAEVKLVKNFKFLQAQAVALPSTAMIASTHYKNCGPESMSTSDTLSVSGTEGWTISKSHSINSSSSFSITQVFSGNTGLVNFGSTSLSFSHTIGVSDSTSSGESSSKTVSRSKSVSISVQNGQAGYTQLLAYQMAIDVPFQAEVVLDGNLNSNVDGKNKASDFLNEKQRTVPFEGVLHLQGLSDGKVTNYDESPAICDKNDKGLIAENTTTSIPASLYKQPMLKKVSLDGTDNVQRSFKHTTKLAEDTIGSPDGISYSITSSYETQRPDPACGYNDFSIPNNANYMIENRHYEQFSNGTLVGSWDNTVETFLGCASGP